MPHTPCKRFGQNFLRDESVIVAIARAVAPAAVDHLVEIVPGEGALTQALIGSGCRLDAIELDRDLRTRLLAAFSTHSGFSLHSADALAFDFASLITEAELLRIVGNLPYNISTPLIFRLLGHAELIADMHFMLQLEVVERLAASPGSKDWGRLGVMAQFQCQVEHLFNVPPEAFYPPPKVQSAVVRLTPRTQLPTVGREALAKVVTKPLPSAARPAQQLQRMLEDSDFEALHIDPSARPRRCQLKTSLPSPTACLPDQRGAP